MSTNSFTSGGFKMSNWGENSPYLFWSFFTPLIAGFWAHLVVTGTSKWRIWIKWTFPFPYQFVKSICNMAAWLHQLLLQQKAKESRESGSFLTTKIICLFPRHPKSSCHTWWLDQCLEAYTLTHKAFGCLQGEPLPVINGVSELVITPKSRVEITTVSQIYNSIYRA